MTRRTADVLLEDELSFADLMLSDDVLAGLRDYGCAETRTCVHAPFPAV